MLAFIGEQFELEKEVTGIVIMTKPNMDTISIWNRNGADYSIRDKIKENLIKCLNLP